MKPTIISLILAMSKDFNSPKYPLDVYFALLRQCATAATPDELGYSIEHLVAWKEGRIRADAQGQFATTSPALRYNITGSRSGDAVWSDRHAKLARSDAFYFWAGRVQKLEHFDINILDELERNFSLWKSVVMPIFVLHCINPRTFPIFDKFVLYAFTVLEESHHGSLAAALTPSRARYSAYQAWFIRLLAEAGIGPMSAQLNQLKEIDSGIWAFGKRADAISKKFSKLSDAVESSLADSAMLDASSDQFKQRAVDLKKSGLTNGHAIEQAAKELGIALKPSYAQYPGSHFNRWKTQGFS